MPSGEIGHHFVEREGVRQDFLRHLGFVPFSGHDETHMAAAVGQVVEEYEPFEVLRDVVVRHMTAHPTIPTEQQEKYVSRPDAARLADIHIRGRFVPFDEPGSLSAWARSLALPSEVWEGYRYNELRTVFEVIEKCADIETGHDMLANAARLRDLWESRDLELESMIAEHHACNQHPAWSGGMELWQPGREPERRAAEEQKMILRSRIDELRTRIDSRFTSAERAS